LKTYKKRESLDQQVVLPRTRD